MSGLGNLLDNPNFTPALIKVLRPDEWEEGTRRQIRRPDQDLDLDQDLDMDQDYTYDLITTPWKIIEPNERQYRLETIPQGRENILPSGSI